MKQEASVAAISSLLGAVIFWGLAPVATRYLLGTLNPMQLLLLRFGIASLLLLPIVTVLHKQRWSRGDIGRIVFCGFTSVIGYNVAATFGLRWLPAGTASLLIATEPIWIALFSVMIERERVRVMLMLGLLLALSGSLLLIGSSVSGAGTTGWQASTIIGVALTLIGAMMWGLYTVAIRPLSHKYGSLDSTAITTIFGTVPLFLFWDTQLLPQLQGMNTLRWFALLFLILGSTILATFLWNYGVAKIASAKAGLFLYMIPVVTVSSGALLLHERVSTTIWVSGLLIIAGVVLAQLQHIPFLKYRTMNAEVTERDR